MKTEETFNLLKDLFEINPMETLLHSLALSAPPLILGVFALVGIVLWKLPELIHECKSKFQDS